MQIIRIVIFFMVFWD